MLETLNRIGKEIVANKEFKGNVEIARDENGTLNIWFVHFNNYYPHNNKFINYYESFNDTKMLAEFEAKALDCIKNGTILEG